MAGASSIPEAIDGFLADVAGAGSERSARTYRSALARFVDFLDETRRREQGLPRRRPAAASGASSDSAEPPLLPDLAEISVQDAVEFTRWLDDYMEREHHRIPSQATVFTYTAAIQSFYAYLHREGLHAGLDLEGLRHRLAKLRGRRDRILPRVPDDQVIESLCQVARAVSPTAGDAAELGRLRDIALLECLRSSGMRVSEAVALKREQIGLNDRSATVRGKGGKDRVVFFSAEAIAALRQYWVARADERVSRHVGAFPAFARHNDAARHKIVPLSTQGVRYIVERLRQRAGEEWPVTPHRLRAWFATHLLDRDVDLASVQDLLGHESANTTRIYTKVRSRRLQDAHRRAFDERSARPDLGSSGGD